MESEVRSRRARNVAYGFIACLLVVILVSSITVRGTSYRPLYGFAKAQHPVEMWDGPDGRWGYYFIGSKPVKDLAESARAELLPLGFSEDRSQAPWVCFVKGNEEVILCNHDEFGVTRGKVEHVKAHPVSGSATATPPTQWSCVLFRNAPFNRGSLVIFTINKVAHGW